LRHKRCNVLHEARNLVMHLRSALALALLCCMAAAAAAQVQPEYQFSGSPRPEFLQPQLHSYVGRSFWIRRPLLDQVPLPLFCEALPPAPDASCPGKKIAVGTTEKFNVEDVSTVGDRPEQSWLKLRFESRSEPVYLSLQAFTQHRYSEGRVSAAQFGIDFALAHSGWFFDDYPPKILDRRRAQFEANRNPQFTQEKLERERVTRFKLLYLGMTAQQVLNSTWGRPNSVSIAASGHDRRRLEQWDYGKGILLYFEDGRLTRIDRGHW
jgi:hypothetical protein